MSKLDTEDIHLKQALDTIRTGFLVDSPHITRTGGKLRSLEHEI